jgi:hypothetical protein
MKSALFGFAGSGKTELFQALAGPGSEHNDRAMVKVPEPRLAPLVELFKPKKVTPTEIEILDLPGGSTRGQGLGQRVLNAVRPYDCLLAVLDHFSGLSDPDSQHQSIETDMIIADLAVTEKRLERIAQDRKKARNLVDPREEELLQRVQAHLEEEKPLRTTPELSSSPELRGFCFLSAKPVLYIWNVTEDNLEAGVTAEHTGEAHLAICAKLERELAEIEDPDERQAFLEDLGLRDSALEVIISKTYELLELITFLTAGEKEVRAWAIPRGLRAPEAAGAIHSDIQKGFIRAEVLSWEDFQAVKTFKAAKEKGVLRLEGKDYVVQDGDIITFRFNV